jgi:DNA invertase Pin-like site-specific DNA recombinase
MLGVFAEFETNLRRERQLEGISAAKARGVSFELIIEERDAIAGGCHVSEPI